MVRRIVCVKRGSRDATVKSEGDTFERALSPRAQGGEGLGGRLASLHGGIIHRALPKGGGHGPGSKQSRNYLSNAKHASASTKTHGDKKKGTLPTGGAASPSDGKIKKEHTRQTACYWLST